MIRARTFFFAIALVAFACGSSSTADTGPADAGFHSNCGHPGDQGNALGVGKFCMGPSDCVMNTMATLCTSIANPDNFFCTFSCMKNGPADQCGAGASCQCEGACGCFPDACNGGPPADASTADTGSTDAATHD
jgi:hypothetical protein